MTCLLSLSCVRLCACVGVGQLNEAGRALPLNLPGPPAPAGTSDVEGEECSDVDGGLGQGHSVTVYIQGISVRVPVPQPAVPKTAM